MHKYRALIPLSKSSSSAFTLIEIIIVIIIVGILAAVGITQYSSIVEKARTAEAKVRIGAMRQLAHEYWLNNGTLIGIAYSDVGVDNNCHSTDFYHYRIGGLGIHSTDVGLVADRCTSGGKTPNALREYYYYLQYYPGTGQSTYYCYYADDQSSCFGLPTGL